MDQAEGLNKAKELFWRYGGNTYQMFRDGIYDEYEKFKVGKVIETSWLREYTNEMLDDFENEVNSKYFKFIPLVDLSIKLNDIALFNSLRSSVAQKQCHISEFSILVMMEKLLRECVKFPSEIKITAALVSQITNEILSNPIEDGYKLVLASGLEMVITIEEITKRFLTLRKESEEILLKNP